MSVSMGGLPATGKKVARGGPARLPTMTGFGIAERV
jgi:hypothetical protein